MPVLLLVQQTVVILDGSSSYIYDRTSFIKIIQIVWFLILFHLAPFMFLPTNGDSVSHTPMYRFPVHNASHRCGILPKLQETAYDLGLMTVSISNVNAAVYACTRAPCTRAHMLVYAYLPATLRIQNIVCIIVLQSVCWRFRSTK